MNLNDYSASIKRLRGSLEREFPSFLEFIVAKDSIALIRKRFRETGLGADGLPFKPYSTKSTLIGAKSFTGKGFAESVLGTREKRRELQWRKVKGHNLAILPGGYAQIRKIEGRQIDHKDFERTSEMWKSIRALRSFKTDIGYAVEIGSEVPLSNKKLEGHLAREGKPILALSKEEEAQVSKTIEDFIVNVFRKSGVL